jgi:protein transport protein SEC31
VCVLVGFVQDPLGSTLLQRALLIGDFASGVKCCIAQNRMADALVLATLGSEDLWRSTADEYFKRSSSRFSRMLLHIMDLNLTQVVEEHPLEDWKEVLVLLASYASPDQQFVTLCEALGDRLVRAGSEQFRQPAIVCYICAFNPVKTIGQWLRALPEKAAAVGLPLAWHDLVEKATVFRKAVERAVDPASGGSLPQALGTPAFPEARVFAQYAFTLANDGALDLAHFYAHLINLPIDPATGRVVDSVAASDPAVEELMCIRNRVHITGGYDPASAPALPLYVPPAPVASGFSSYPPVDTGFGSSVSHPSQVCCKDRAYAGWSLADESCWAWQSCSFGGRECVIAFVFGCMCGCRCVVWCFF